MAQLLYIHHGYTDVIMAPGMKPTGKVFKLAERTISEYKMQSKEMGKLRKNERQIYTKHVQT